MNDFGLDPEQKRPLKKRKKKMSKSPTVRSLKLLHDRGYTTYISEYWCAFSQRRKDLFNFIDITCLHIKERGVLGVQTTSGSGLSARVKKAEELESYWLWLSCGNSVEFHGWRKLKSGWAPKIIRVSYSDILG